MLEDQTPLVDPGETTTPAYVLDSAALARLVAEVRDAGSGQTFPVAAYNRTYHRHNR